VGNDERVSSERGPGGKEIVRRKGGGGRHALRHHGRREKYHAERHTRKRCCLNGTLHNAQGGGGIKENRKRRDMAFILINPSKQEKALGTMGWKKTNFKNNSDLAKLIPDMKAGRGRLRRGTQRKKKKSLIVTKGAREVKTRGQCAQSVSKQSILGEGIGGNTANKQQNKRLRAKRPGGGSSKVKYKSRHDSDMTKIWGGTPRVRITNEGEFGCD